MSSARNIQEFVANKVIEYLEKQDKIKKLLDKLIDNDNFYVARCITCNKYHDRSAEQISKNKQFIEYTTCYYCHNVICMDCSQNVGIWKEIPDGYNKTMSVWMDEWCDGNIHIQSNP